jgi:hypothetical protein
MGGGDCNNYNESIFVFRIYFQGHLAASSGDSGRLARQNTRAFCLFFSSFSSARKSRMPIYGFPRLDYGHIIGVSIKTRTYSLRGRLSYFFFLSFLSGATLLLFTFKIRPCVTMKKKPALF